MKNLIAFALIGSLLLTRQATADEAATLSQLKSEKAGLEKRLTKVNEQIDKLRPPQTVKLLGMTLAEPDEKLIQQYHLSAEWAGPIIISLEDDSIFTPGMKPTVGCAFSIFEHPTNGFLFGEVKQPSYHPKTIHDFARAVIECSVPPEEYQMIWDHTSQAARAWADKNKDDRAESERMRKIADKKMPQEEIGKYICRLVYDYPSQAGTMTTYIHLTKAQLDEVREYLKK